MQAGTQITQFTYNPEGWKAEFSGGSMLGPGGTGPKSCPAPSPNF